MNSSWYPNSALPAWTLALIAIVAVGTLTVWLVAVYRADRPQSKPRGAASPAGSGQAPASPAGTGPAAVATGEKAPGLPAADRRAA